MKKIIWYSFLFVLIISGLSCGSKQGNDSKSLSGKVVGVIDGDTYDLLMDGNETIRIRMEGIDAPEKGMPFYKKAKKHLSDLCFGKIVRLDVKEKDRYGRKVAFSYLDDGTELSHEMIKVGLAWHYKKYNNDPDLASLEMQARDSRRGIWVDESPMPPWENRKYHRNGISTKDSFDINLGQD